MIAAGVLAALGGPAAGALGIAVALHARASARGDRLALRLARAREAVFVEISRRLADAARRSAASVRDVLAEAALEVAPAGDGVLLYEEHDGALVCVHALGERVSYFAGSRVALDDTQHLAVRALLAGHRVGGADGVPLHPRDADGFAVPLALDAGRLCVLAVCARRALDGDARDRLAALADQASPAYLIALEREEDRRRAEYDGLTGLLTPRAFRARLTALVERARSAPAARLALLFVDTDRFKLWNDTFGHAAGDALLGELAKLLRSSLRFEGELAARNGGDEFCVVFTDSAKADAIERAEALRAAIARADFGALCGIGGTAPHITASIGVAAYPADGTTAQGLLERADAAMYHSKHAGRDAVSYAGSDGVLTRLVTVPA